MPGTAVVYVVSRWGEPTQTFVRREAEAVAGLGIDVTALSLKPLGPARSDVPSRHLGPRALAAGLARIATRRPLVTLGVIGSVVGRSAPRNVGRQLAAALIGLAWAGRGEVDGRSLHAHFGWVAATAAWAAARAGDAPFTVVLHAFEIHSHRYQDRFTGVPLRAAARVFVISERDRSLVSTHWSVDPTVLRMGVPEAWLAVAPGTPDPPGLVLSVGSLVAKKGHDVLLRALAECPSSYVLEIVGTGPERHELGALCERLGLRDRVTFAGALPELEVRRRMQSAWVVALAAIETEGGDRDGVPVALMEAMALGTPVVSTDAGAIPELVAGAGIIVPAGDVGAFAAALQRVSDPALRAELGAAGRARVREGWTVERSAALVAEAHRALVG